MKKKKLKTLNLKNGDQESSDDESDENEMEEEDEESYFQSTGTYLNKKEAKSSLQKTNIDIKICTDANKEEPHQVNSQNLNNLNNFLNNQFFKGASKIS